MGLLGCYGLALLLLTWAPGAKAQVVEPLTLRVADAIGVPGGEIAVVIRTYASRGVGRGQLCLKATPPAGVARGEVVAGTSSPLASFLGGTVFAAEGDAVIESSVFDPLTQTFDILFSSLSGSVNALDGPLAVLRFSLAPDVQPNDVFNLELIALDSFLEDGAGKPIVIELRAGELDVVAPGLPLAIEGEADLAPWVPGEPIPIGPSTAAVQAIGSARFGLRYAPSELSQPPVVRLDPRFGLAEIVGVSQPEAGLVVVDVLADDDTYGTVPGMLVAVEVWISACGADAPALSIGLDPAWTQVRGPGGEILAIELFGDLVTRSNRMSDGFESGDLRRWCVPADPG